jgi:steroid 5-alpha reductase family enzyme
VTNWQSVLAALPAILMLALAGWFASLLLAKASIVDSLWPLFLVIAAGVYAVDAGPWAARAGLVAVLLLLWAIRLCVYVTVRNHGEPEDHRYQALRERFRPFHWKSLYVVFGLQALLAWIVSWSLYPPIVGSNSFSTLDAVALALWLTGMAFEVGGDWQLARFRANAANAGKVLDQGLWRYTRHPNYFGEFCIWWSFYLFSVAAGAWWTILSPLLMTVLLLRVSGVTLLERTLRKRRPDYEQYVARTNAFFPGRPRPAGDSNRGRPR